MDVALLRSRGVMPDVRGIAMDARNCARFAVEAHERMVRK
jgi:hypothetical protein